MWLYRQLSNSHKKFFTVSGLGDVIGVDIGKGSANGNLIVPDLAEALATSHLVIIVPAVGIETDTELEEAVVVEGGGDAVLLVHLDAVEPDLEVAGAIGCPLNLEDDLVPLAWGDGTEVGASDDVAAAVGLAVVAVDVASVQLAVLGPDHGGGHPVIAATASTRAVGNELGKVVGLGRRLPRIGQAEHEAVEEFITTLVALVVVDLGVVAVMVRGAKVVLGHLESRGALVDNIGNFRDSSLSLCANEVPAVEVAIVVKGAGGAGRWQESQGGGEKGLESNHFESDSSPRQK